MEQAPLPEGAHAQEVAVANVAGEAREQDAMEEGDGEEEWWAESLEHLQEDAFDLYDALHVSKAVFNVDRARASYHRLSYRYHPETGAQGGQDAFCRLTLAYAVLKDEERRRIYDELGFASLVRSESYMDPSVFETDPYEFYERFYSGEDPADKEYFLVNGPEVHMSDSEEEEAEEEEEEEAEELPKVELSEAEKERLAQRAKELEAKPMPAAPAAVLVSSSAFGPRGADIFTQIARSTN
jgi:hypothetical protein